MSYIKIEVSNDDHIALRAFGKALEEMALAHGAEPLQLQTYCNVTMNDEQTDQLRQKLKNVLGEPRMMQELQGKREEPEIDTTAQQFDETASFAEIAEAAPTTDATGTPWDERIHSTSKALNADGTWRLRRKPKDMDEAEWAALVESVKAELTYREQLKEETEQSFADEPTREEVNELIEASNEMLGVIEPPVTPPGDDFHTDADVVSEQTVAGIPPIPVPPVATGAMLDALAEIPVAPPLPHTIPVPVADEQKWDFPKLMKFLTERHGKIDVPTVNQLLAVDGLAALTDLNAHPDKIGPFVARVKAHLGE